VCGAANVIGIFRVRADLNEFVSVQYCNPGIRQDDKIIYGLTGIHTTQAHYAIILRDQYGRKRIVSIWNICVFTICRRTSEKIFRYSAYSQCIGSVGVAGVTTYFFTWSSFFGIILMSAVSLYQDATKFMRGVMVEPQAVCYITFVRIRLCARQHYLWPLALIACWNTQYIISIYTHYLV
jgi:hypothetical protein